MTQCNLPAPPELMHRGGGGGMAGGGGAAAAGGMAGGAGVEYPPGDKGPPRPLETVTCFKVGRSEAGALEQKRELSSRGRQEE